MRDILNYILNRVFGVRRRYADAIVVGAETVFLPMFSLSKSSSFTSKKKPCIGEGCMLGVRLILEHADAEVVIGDRVYIGKSDIICRNQVVIEDDVMVAWGVTFYDHDSHSLSPNDRRGDMQQMLKDCVGGDFLKNKNWDAVNSSPIRIERNAWIGMEALILKGVTIGEGAIVAARSVVTKDVPAHSVVAGNPACVVKQLK